MVSKAGQRSYRFKGAWRGATRQTVLKRQGYRCYFGCPGADSKGKGLQLAHIADDAQGGAATPDNLVAMCGTHHAQFDAGKRRAARGRR